jgi:XTP/dITP diphosphohydrolase
MITIFVATSNKGKQAEIAQYAEQYGKDIMLRFPDEANKLDVEESGKTFEENALLKANAYRKALGDDSLFFVGDDSGIKIPALNNEPGVFTRRWAGYEMTDTEVLEYCMEKMKNLHGKQRSAIFETVLAVVRANEEPQHYRGKMPGRILEKPIGGAIIDGFPFRSIFWVSEIERPIYEIHGLKPEERDGFLTHREKAFKELFENLTA